MRRETKLKLLLVLVASLIPIVAAEILVRFLSPYGYATPAIERQRVFAYDGSIFSRHVLRAAKRTVHEGPVDYPINSLGYRGREFDFEKPSNVVRVIVYGGSTVLDLAASEYRDWPSRIQDILRSNGLSHVEVINAGVAGHATFDALGRFYAEGHLLRPDYVLLYDAWNDIKYFRFPQPILRVFRTYREDPRLTYHGLLDRALCNTSQFYVRLRNRFLNWKYRAGAEGSLPNSAGPALIQESKLRQYRLNLELFVDAARNVQAVPILMTEARLATRNTPPDLRQRIPYEYTSFDHQTLCDAFDCADRIVKEVGRDKGIEVIDAAAVMTGNTNLLYDHVHTTSAGSQVLAELAASRLERLIRRSAE